MVCYKVKARLGSDVSESDLEEEETDSESAESEDEDGEEMTPAVDVAILRTLARIRQKDPSIYDSGKSVFDGMLLFWTLLEREVSLTTHRGTGETCSKNPVHRQK